MEDLEKILIGAITTKMPRDKSGQIIDKLLHSDLITVINDIFNSYK